MRRCLAHLTADRFTVRGTEQGVTIQDVALHAFHAHDLPDALPSGRSMHLHGLDGGEWLLRGTPDGLAWERGHTKADVAVRGTAGALYLLLNRRLSADDPGFEIYGDRAVLDTWLATTIF